MQPLTFEQRKLAEENHNLIYYFAQKNHLSIDDYYGILAIGLCNASKAYDKSKGSFSTLAYKSMLYEYLRYKRDRSRKHVIPDEMIVSYNNPSNNVEENDKDDRCFIRYLADRSFSIQDNVINKVIIEEVFKTLNAKEKTILEYYKAGFKQPEIARSMNCTRQNINKITKTIREKLQLVLDN